MPDSGDNDTHAVILGGDRLTDLHSDFVSTQMSSGFPTGPYRINPSVQIPA